MITAFNNIVTQRDLKYNLMQVFSELTQILVHHAGPFATDSVIGSKWRQVNDVDEFTKDGIKILKHLIVSEDSAARFAVRLARFIGIAVDKRCHDGTTTSMLLFCRLACIALECVGDPVLDPTYSDLDNRRRWRLIREIREVIEFCLDELNKIKITEDDLLALAKDFGLEQSITDVRAAIAYHMAMISSKGDHDLSSKISTVISRVPKKIYGMFRDTALAVETDEKYILKHQDHDLLINANLGDLRMYNHRNDSQFLAQDAVIFATGNEIITNSDESAFLKAFISTNPKYRAELADFGVEHGWEKYHEDKRQLVILTQMMNDSELIAIINTFNLVNPKCKIVYLTTQVHGRLRTSLNKTLHYIAGKPVFHDVATEDATLSLIGLHERGVEAHLIGYNLALRHLYQKDGGVYHPLYRDSEVFPPYTEFVKETEELIEFATSNITNPALDPAEVTYLTSLYRSLTCQEIYDIEIGGSAHDQYANRTVYEDAIGAALAAVNEGIVLGGYAHIAKALLERFPTQDTTGNLVGEAFLRVVCDTVRKTDSTEVRNLIDTELLDKWSYVAADRETYYGDGEYVFSATLDSSRLCDMFAMTPATPVLMQAWSGYHEQLRRFRDILPRLANTTHLVDMRIDESVDVR